MSKSFEVQGQVHSIGATTEYGNNGFTKREFVVKLSGEDENPTYPNYIALELIKDKCALMDSYKIGNEIKVHFNLSGRLWSAPDKPEKCFISLQAWRIESVSSEPNYSKSGYSEPSYPEPDYSNQTPAFSSFDIDDDIPF